MCIACILRMIAASGYELSSLIRASFFLVHLTLVLVSFDFFSFYKIKRDKKKKKSKLCKMEVAKTLLPGKPAS